ncbi:MAG: hypothetical protein JSV17_09680 [Candidatus Aminicenantes bacterium]|nr:MAG: hypothetical protein JSV17_09680 [Candidatus Aminicenantes bacterium]
MAIQTNKTDKVSRFIGVILLSFLLVAFGSVTCKKAGEGETEEETPGVVEGIMPFEGSVKTVVGKYMFLPETSGFDIVIQGNLESGTLEDLIGNNVRGEGDISPDTPSILVANTLEVLGESGDWTNVFTRTEDPVFEDYLDLSAREEFVALADLSYDKKDVWEENEKAKVYGSLEMNDTGDKIAVFDDEGQEIGKILVDSYTDFSQFYLEKLGYFDKFWFYFKVKETVDWSQRRRTREMFHADVVFAGLF